VRAIIACAGLARIALILEGWSANRNLSRNGLAGSAEIGFQDSGTSQLSLAPTAASDRIVSPNAPVETGLRMCLPEKKRGYSPYLALSSPFSAVRPVWEQSRNTGTIRVSRRRAGGISLRFRLRGGEGGIRTLGTGVSPYNGLAKHRASFLQRVFKHLARSEFFRVVGNVVHIHLN
jgi:hypothetical protein